MTTYTLKFEPKQVKHAMIVLRKFNPGPYIRMDDIAMYGHIVSLLLETFEAVSWNSRDSYACSTGGYWLQYIKAPYAGENTILCEVLIDPYIMILDHSIDGESEFVIKEEA